MKKNVTMRDIGAALGVSTVTISKALGGKEGVSDAVREKIIETAKKMGYRYGAPQPEDTGKVICVLIADRLFSSPSFYFFMYRALLKELSEAGMLGALEIVSEQDERSLAMPAAASVPRTSGYVVLGQLNAEYVSAVVESGLPTVLMDFYVDGLDVDAVISDGLGGGFLITRYLLERGHREIGFVGSLDRSMAIVDRFSGFMRAMRSFGLKEREEWLIPDADSSLCPLETVPLPQRLPTALFCNNDMLANRVIRQLERMGLRVPEDISVAGFGDFVYSNDVRKVTSFTVDMQRMAQETVRRLKHRMQEGMEGPLRTAVGGWLVERDSVMKFSSSGRA